MCRQDNIAAANGPQGGLTYTFDTDGSLESRSDGASFTHDPRNRLLQFVKGVTTANYLYDASGRRIRKTVNGTNTWFLWDGAALIAEYDAAGIRTQRYGYLAGDYAPTQLQDANGTYYVHSDHLKTPRVATNSAAQTVWRSRHHAFGDAIVEPDVDGNGTAIALNVRFPGQYFDPETGLHYNYFRDYDPGLRRYSQQDPIGQAGGINLYAYAKGHPLRWIDPLGLDACIVNDKEALEAEEERKKTENEKIIAQLLGDEIAYDNAVQRINDSIRDYDAAMCCGPRNDAPRPPRIAPTPTPPPPVDVGPPPQITIEIEGP